MKVVQGDALRSDSRMRRDQIRSIRDALRAHHFLRDARHPKGAIPEIGFGINRGSRQSESLYMSISMFSSSAVEALHIYYMITIARMSATTTATETQSINADNILRLFPQIDRALTTHAATRQDNDLEGYDEEQIRLMDEVCIVLDEDDKPIGSASKKICMYKHPTSTLLSATQSP